MTSALPRQLTSGIPPRQRWLDFSQRHACFILDAAILDRNPSNNAISLPSLTPKAVPYINRGWYNRQFLVVNLQIGISLTSRNWKQLWTPRYSVSSNDCRNVTLTCLKTICYRFLVFSQFHSLSSSVVHITPVHQSAVLFAHLYTFRSCVTQDNNIFVHLAWMELKGNESERERPEENLLMDV